MKIISDLSSIIHRLDVFLGGEGKRGIKGKGRTFGKEHN